MSKQSECNQNEQGIQIICVCGRVHELKKSESGKEIEYNEVVKKSDGSIFDLPLIHQKSE